MQQRGPVLLGVFRRVELGDLAAPLPEAEEEAERERADEQPRRDVGLHGLRRPDAPLDLGNSGTSMRLMAGVLAGQAFDSVLVGDASLSRRPMRRIADPLRAMGAAVATEADGTPPVRLGAASLAGIDYASPVASAQVKSCVLLAGLGAPSRTSTLPIGIT